MADEYVCTLDDVSLQKARDELNEDPRERMSQVKTFRKWILEQPQLSCPTDTFFLLRFLRQAKFSQLRARELLSNNLTLKKEQPEWFQNTDMQHPMVDKFMRTGYLLKLPKPSSKGERIIIVRMGAFDPKGHTYRKEELMKGLMGIITYLFYEERAMVDGLVMMCDFTGFTIKHQLFWGMDSIIKSTKCWQNRMPGRYKAIHIYNMAPVAEGIISIIKPLMKKKFQDRIFLHGNNMESVYKVIPMEYLPRDYLPDEYTGPHAGTVADLTDMFIREIQEDKVRDRILYESDTKWGMDKAAKSNDVPNESFRKLNIE